MQSDHLLHCIGNVYLFKEIFLEGCGNSCGELAQWGCTTSLFLTKQCLELGSLRCFIVAELAGPGLYKFVNH